MSNYQQPDAKSGAYTPTPVNMACPLCSSGNVATARMIGSGSFEWRCSNGHRFTSGFYAPPVPFTPIRNEPNAETRILLTDLQTLRG
jgi:hypothetical protein